MSPAQGARAAGLEVGRNAFKFAQGKFPPTIAHELATHEREKLRREAAAFIRAHCFREGATHYQVLNVPSDAKRDAIKESYHLLMALIHPDRAEAAREAWPAEWAQRANRAYAVLEDDSTRADYDKAHDALGAFAPPSRRPLRRRTAARPSFKARMARGALVLCALVAVLAGVAWLDSAEQHFPFTGAARGRDIGVARERPRFLGMGVVPARDTAEEVTATAPPRREAQLAPLWHEPAAARAVQTRPAPPAEPTDVADSPPLPAPEREPDVMVAQASATAPRPSEARLTNAQIELVVARLIGYYEAGETENLMALLDPKEAGLAQTARARQAYFDFFRATRQRRLQVRSLEWKAAPASARAQGQATLQAEYVGTPGSLERDIDLDMEIALRNGQARITRLSLFPNAP